MKTFIRTFLLTITLLFLLMQVGLSLPVQPGTNQKPPMPSPAIAPEQNTDSICFFQKADGTVVDLSKVCQGGSGGTNQAPRPVPSNRDPYNDREIKQFDDRLYGPNGN